jgi:2-dehydro-3-deoxygluconokinase
MPEIIALGEPMVEFAAEEPGRLSDVTTFRRGWGGDTSNCVVAAARLGASCGYITRLGTDEFGRAFIRLWNREGIDVSRVIPDSDGYTGLYFITFDAAGRQEFSYYRTGSAASRLRPDDLDPHYLRGARIFHTSGISQAISNSARMTVDAAIELVRGRGVTISYDLNIRPRLRPLALLRQIIEATVPLVDIVFMSRDDARYLYGEAKDEDAIGRVLRQGPQMVVLKRGQDGCLIRTAEGARVSVDGWPVSVVDATGAGDAFDGAFLVEWLRGLPLEEVGHFANTVGALTAAGLGAVSPLPTRAEVDAFISEATGVRRNRIRRFPARVRA